MTNIKYAGKDFRQDLGLYVDSIESYGTPKKSYTFHEVLGRNGSLAVDDHRFEDHEETFNCYIRQDFVPNFRNVQAFFNSLKGYQRLERSNEPDYFEMGLYEGEISPRPTQLLQAGVFPFRLRLHPEKWLKSGETAVDAASTSETLEGNPIQFENPSGLTSLTGLNVDIEPVQSGEGDPSPTNIRPITGHTSATVQRTGKNLLPMPITSGSYANDVTIKVNEDKSFYITKPNGNGWTTFQLGAFTLPKGTYTVIESDDSSQNARIILTNATTSAEIIHTRYTSRRTFTLNETTTIRATYSRSASADNVLTRIMLFVGDTAVEKDYEPYQGDIYAIDLGDARYGGELDVSTGVLTVDRVCKTLTTARNLSGTYQGSIIYNQGSPETSDADFAKPIICNRLKYVGNWITDFTVGTVINYNNVSFNLWLKDGAFSSLSEATAWLNENETQICYYLATPNTIQLTPQQVSLLTGTNIISTDMNNLTITVSNPSELENPTLFESKPLIRIYGTGTVNINNDYITIDSASPFTFIDLDCETMNASSAGDNANQYIEILNDAEITLKPGTNYVAYSGSITTVEITPRWYTI